jgi:hypothetical protein
LENEHFEKDLLAKIDILIKENFNESQHKKLFEWLNMLFSRPIPIQPIQFNFKKDNFNKIIIFYETSRFDGVGRNDTSWIEIIDERGNKKNFEVGESRDDYNTREERWKEKELSKQLYRNSESIIFIYREGGIFIENKRKIN